MNLVRFLRSFGFSGIKKQNLSAYGPREAKGATFTSVDPAVIRKQFGRAKIHCPKTGRFLFLLDRTKAIRIDTVNNRVVLANGPPAVAKLRKSMEK